MIKRGAICVDDHDRAFIVTVEEPKSTSWNGEFSGNMWVGTVLVDGTPTLCAKPRVIAESFKAYVATIAGDIGVKAAQIEIAELRGRLNL